MGLPSPRACVGRGAPVAVGQSRSEARPTRYRSVRGDGEAPVLVDVRRIIERFPDSFGEAVDGDVATGANLARQISAGE